MKTKVYNSGSNKGQVMVEAVLLITLFVALWSVFSKYAKEKKWFESLVNGPWLSMSGVIENGVWENPKKSRTKHPNNFNRVISLKE